MVSKRSFTREIWPERIAGLQQSETFRLPIDTALQSSRDQSGPYCPSLRIGDNFHDLHEGKDFCFIFDSAATMNRILLRETLGCLIGADGNKRKLKQDE
jgi:hypothetical protein